MNKIILTLILTAAFFCLEANAQTVFIPQPPAIRVPLLDPSRMIIQNEVIRNTVNGATRRGATNAAKTQSPAKATAVDYTMFNARQENFLPKLLAQSSRGNAAEQRQAEQFYTSQIEMYEQTANYHRYPANDVAFALDYFIANNYEIYYDLVVVDKEKDPWAKRAKNGLERLALMGEKSSKMVTPIEDKAMYFQLKNMLSANPDFRKMTDEQKQKMTETLAIKYGIVRAEYLKAIDEEDERSISRAHEAAKQNLEQLLGVPVAKIRITVDGLHLQ